MKNLTTQDLKEILKGGGELHLTSRAVKEMLSEHTDGSPACPDLAWLFGSAMEAGNSEAVVQETVTEFPIALYDICFSQAGCCTKGIVMEVHFRVRYDKLSEKLQKKVDSGEIITGIYPEDVWQPLGGFLSTDAIHEVVISYDEYEDEDDED